MRPLTPRLGNQIVGNDKSDIEVPGQRFEPAGNIDGAADNREFQPVRADIAEHGLAEVDAESGADGGFAVGGPLRVPGFHLGNHGPGAPQRAARVGVGSRRRAERRHQTVAQIFVERPVVPEHLAFHAGMKLAQDLDHMGGRQPVGQSVKPTISTNRTATFWVLDLL